MQRSPSCPVDWLRGLVALTMVVILVGCTRKPPLGLIVAAPSGFKLMMWKADVADDFTHQEWQDFEAAVQEIKYGVMIAGEASGSDAVDAATWQKIDGLTVRDVLKTGLGHKLARLMNERNEFLTYIEHNQELRVRDGDEASADYLRTLREHQDRRVDRLNEQITVTKEIFRRRGIPIDDQVSEKAKPAVRKPV